MLIDGSVEVGPLARHLHVRLIGEPPVTGSVPAGPGSLDELRGETPVGFHNLVIAFDLRLRD
jgi:hypothetical protein